MTPPVITHEFLDPAQIERAVGALTRVWGSRGWVIIGGLAAQRWGSRRLTYDIDILVSSPRVPDPRTPSTPLGGLQGFEGVTTMITGVPLDIMWPTTPEADTLTDACLDGAIIANGTPFASFSSVTALKMWAGRGKDLDDVCGMFQAQSCEAQRAAIRTVRHYVGTDAIADLRGHRAAYG